MKEKEKGGWDSEGVGKEETGGVRGSKRGAHNLSQI